MRPETKGDRARRQLIGEEGGGRRPDASMTLITSMLERPLDPGYQAAADERTRSGLPASTGGRTWLVVLAMVVVGLLVGTAAVELRGRESSRAETRRELITRIEERQHAVDGQISQVRSLQREVDAAAAALEPRLPGDGAVTVERLRMDVGAIAVTGPGLRIVVDDAPDTEGADGSDPRNSQSSDGRVQSRDIQIVVNALWAAGAEAVAVNGQRLTSRTAIRFAGDAILVNFRPLTRPYTVEAVGDTEAMRARFAAGPGGAYLAGLQQNFGIAATIEPADSLTLPSVASTTLREARPAADGTDPKETS